VGVVRPVFGLVRKRRGEALFFVIDLVSGGRRRSPLLYERILQNFNCGCETRATKFPLKYYVNKNFSSNQIRC
jgi:hypothetical protein